VNEDMKEQMEEAEDILNEVSQKENQDEASNVEESAPENVDPRDQKLKELDDKLLRTYAEYDNFRKRTQKEKDVMFGDGQVAAITEVLPILDNLERALGVKIQSEDAKTMAQGIEMIVNQFKDTLIKLNITPIETDGQEFDPEKHNAVMHIDDENYGQNVIVEELMRGYQYKDKVIRHSMVKVAN
jgi:Molecular chaperone GrpE (heat shock protein)